MWGVSRCSRFRNLICKHTVVLTTVQTHVPRGRSLYKSYFLGVIFYKPSVFHYNFTERTSSYSWFFNFLTFMYTACPPQEQVHVRTKRRRGPSKDRLSPPQHDYKHASEPGCGESLQGGACHSTICHGTLSWVLLDSSPRLESCGEQPGHA